MIASYLGTPPPALADLGRVWVAGETGMIGQALHRRLGARGVTPISAPHATLELRDSAAVAAWMSETRPDTVFFCAGRPSALAGSARVATPNVADQLTMQQAVITAAMAAGVPRLVYTASAAAYGPGAPVPTPETRLETLPPPEDLSPYGRVKRLGTDLILACRQTFGFAYTAVVPGNVFGPGEPISGPAARVVGSLTGRLLAARRDCAEAVEVWGSGQATRDFLYVDDVADAMVIAAGQSDFGVLNIGSGKETTIAALAEALRDATGYRGALRFRADLPEGAPRSLLETRRLTSLGWRPRYTLTSGIARLVGHLAPADDRQRTQCPTGDRQAAQCPAGDRPTTQ